MSPPLRADAQQNRDRLIAAAREAFAAPGTASLEAIAEAAGVGIGTLYRHFPQREALVEAVYRDQIAELSAGADRLLAGGSAPDALRAWMDLFAAWADAKRGMIDALAAMRRSGALDLRGEIEGILGRLLAAGAKEGSLRADIDAVDLRSLLAGILAAAADAAQRERLFDFALSGLRA